jgi:SSS family solute:Na+ symporter
LPAWISGLAFISANLGAVEIIGMSANGAEYGMPTMHYYWIGAVPAMLFTLPRVWERFCIPGA